MKRQVILIAISVFILIVVYIGISFYTIYVKVDRITEKAKTEFRGDAVEALTCFINSGNHSFAEKNSAIWALGQFADPRALPFLERLYNQTRSKPVTGRNEALSNKEIVRAIKWCHDGNLTSWMYKRIK